MAFMMKKKKYRFNVEVQLQDLVEVALVNEVLFAKIRLLEGGSFQEYSSREEVKNHRVEWNRSFQFPCKMSANASTGVLDPNHLRISIRKEMKGGRSYFKLGFIDINLAEFAGAGLISRRFLLEGYDSRHRLDNSMLRVTIKMHMLSGDILFKAPTPSLKSKQKPSTDDLSTASTGGGLQTPTANAMPPIVGISSGPANIINSGSAPGGGGLGGGIVPSSRPISTLRDDAELDPQSLIAAIGLDSGLSESSESAIPAEQFQLQQPAPCLVPANTQAVSYGGIGVTAISGGVNNNSAGLNIIGSNNCGTTSSLVLSGSGGLPSGIPITSSIIEMGHSRNSSNTSQLSKGSGYSSFSHSQHSRQSSEGDSGHARFSKSVSLLIRLNQRTLNAMQLSIPPAYTNQRPISAPVAINECADDVSENYETPNATFMRDEEFRTPLTELPQNSAAGGLTVQALYGATQSLSPTYYSIASSGSSRNGSHASQICDESGSDSEADDSGLDENYHTPRVAKIKSMENISLLEMEFHKASQELDRNSPRRLKIMAEHASFPKMKSLNNLSIDNYTDAELKEEFTRMREHSLDEKQRFQFQQRKYSNSSNSSGKMFTKNKVGNAKFIGGDDTPDIKTEAHVQPFVYRNMGNVASSPHPIQKMRSMGTIPDVLGERIEPDPFLTPTSGRKPQFPFVTQSAEKPTPPSYIARLMNCNDVVDGSSLQDFYTQNRLYRMTSEPVAAAHMSRSPFERAYKRNAIKSSTPFRQSISHIQHQAAHDHQQQQQQQQAPFLVPQVEPSLRRPHSTNAAYDIMRSYSGVPRRLLDGSNRQISFIAQTNTNSPSNASTSNYSTLGSLNSTHSASSSSGSSSSSGALITYQCAHGTDTVDAYIPPTVHTPGSGANSPRLVHLSSVELSSLAASPTDACSLRSNPSAASLLATATAAAALDAVASTTGITCCNLSPLATTQIIRRPSITMNPSSGSLVVSETGSLDRTKTNTEKRKKGPLDDGPRVSDRVEETRVNPNSLIDEILKDTKLDQLEESAETSGLQLYIARDGTAALGSHEVKSRVNAGSFKQVVMQNPR